MSWESHVTAPDFLDFIIAAHGGLEPWQRAGTIEADVAYCGLFWELKGVRVLARSNL